MCKSPPGPLESVAVQELLGRMNGLSALPGGLVSAERTDEAGLGLGGYRLRREGPEEFHDAEQGLVGVREGTEGFEYGGGEFEVVGAWVGGGRRCQGVVFVEDGIESPGDPRLPGRVRFFILHFLAPGLGNQSVAGMLGRFRRRFGVRIRAVARVPLTAGGGR